MITKQRQAILFLSNKTSDSIIGEFKSLASSVGDLADVFFVYHQCSPEIPDVIQELNYFAFTNDILHELTFKPLDNHSLLPGSDHFPLFKFYLTHPEYDYYWHIEDDVRFCGEWKTIFEMFKDQDADFIASHLTKIEDDPDWYWWKSLTKKGKAVSLKKALRSFNAMHRISNKALKFLHAELSDGWGGHHEVVIPTLLYRNNFKIIDFGGDGVFVPTGNEFKLYTHESMSHLPIRMGNVRNRIYHPVKEFKKNCIIATVGKKSLHKNWLHQTQNYDVHLIVYDDSYSGFKHDSAYVSADKGYKLKLVYRYLEKHPEYLAQYEYFFIPDDDILMDYKSIEQLFELMQQYSLSIAQPALFDSYYTYDSLIRDKYTILRYTNFIEMMLPCFSKEALKKVLFTFNENESGWGADYHWPHIINFTGKEMAVLDRIPAVHSRPIQSAKAGNFNDLTEYTLKYNLKKDIREFGCIYIDKVDENFLITDRNKYKLIENSLHTIANFLKEKYIQIENVGLFNGKSGLSLFFINYYQLTGNRIFYDLAFFVFESVEKQINAINDNITFSSGLSGIAWFIEYLAQNNYIENETDELLEEISSKIDDNDFSTYKDLSLNNGLVGIGIYYLARIKNQNFSLNNERHLKEKGIIQEIVYKLQSYLQEKTGSDISEINIRDITHIMLFFAQYNTTEKCEPVTLPEPQIEWLEKQCSYYIQNTDEHILGVEYSYDSLLYAYTLFQYFATCNKKEQQACIIESLLDYSKKMLQSRQVSSATFHSSIELAYIYFLFYQKSNIESFKRFALFFLDKVIYEKDNLRNELDTFDIKKLLASSFILTQLLANTLLFILD